MENEKTLIYKEDLLNTVLYHFGIGLAYLGEDLQFCQEAIELAPTVDAVPAEEYNALKEKYDKLKEKTDLLFAVLHQHRAKNGG